MEEPIIPPPPRIWAVAPLLLAVGDTLQARFGACGVRGELSGFSRAASGHCYFTLKDADGAAASLRCAMFRRAASLLGFAPRDGQQVEVRGRIAVYEPRGELQLIVESMQSVGAGALYEQFLRLKASLGAEGLFDAACKRPIVAQPRSVGIVTSLGAAALHDVVTCLARRAPHVRLVVYPSLVQGPEAAAALVEALAIAARRDEVDTLLLCRGGGSLEDLWAFNDARVVRAVAASPIPVVCGVGHETDVTLADLAADLRAATPTAAAELAAPSRADLLDALSQQQRRAALSVQRQLQTQAQRLDRLSWRLSRPGEPLQRAAERLRQLDQRRGAALSQALADARRRADALGQRHSRAAGAVIDDAARRLDGLGHRLRALDPRGVLARGYAWITDGSNQPVLSASALVPGATITAVWADGQARASVLDVTLGPP